MIKFSTGKVWSIILMIAEHSCVYSKYSIGSNIKKGCKGVVVSIYNKDIVEVEFVDDNLSTIDILTVNIEQIECNKTKE